MRLGLIGCTGHWQTYAAALAALPELEIGAVCTAAPDERLSAFDEAPGVRSNTRRAGSPAELLALGDLDAVQVSTRSDLVPALVRAALERRLPVMAEKPIACTLDDLAGLHDLARTAGVPVAAMHAQRGTPLVAAVRDAVRAGAIGAPLLVHSQKSYRWGQRRRRPSAPGPPSPGGALHRDPRLRLAAVDPGRPLRGRGGRESPAARPEYAACASHAAYLLRLTEGGLATVTLDYLRPEAAPTHGDERLRLVGTGGVIDVAVATGTGVLLDAGGPRDLDLSPPAPWYAAFLRSISGAADRVDPVLPQWEVFRATEVSLKAQQAADTGRRIDLRETAYRPG